MGGLTNRKRSLCCHPLSFSQPLKHLLRWGVDKKKGSIPLVFPPLPDPMRKMGEGNSFHESLLVNERVKRLGRDRKRGPWLCERWEQGRKERQFSASSFPSKFLMYPCYIMYNSLYAVRRASEYWGQEVQSCTTTNHTLIVHGVSVICYFYYMRPGSRAVLLV